MLDKILEVLPALDAVRLGMVDKQCLGKLGRSRIKILRGRSFSSSWSWQKACAAESSVLFDGFNDFNPSDCWRIGPNCSEAENSDSRSNGNVLEKKSDEDGLWICLSGGTDWSAFQGIYRSIDEGVFPNYISFLVKVDTPDVSCASISFFSSRTTWGFSKPVLMFSYQGMERTQQCCFALQCGSIPGKSDYICRPEPKILSNKVYEVVIKLDWKQSYISVFINGHLQLERVPCKLEEPIRYVSFFNWRSRAQSSLSQLMLGNLCPTRIISSDLSLDAALELKSGRLLTMCRLLVNVQPSLMFSIAVLMVVLAFIINRFVT